MFERYTQRARTVIFESRSEAELAHCSQIEPLHMLIGMARADPALLGHLNVKPQEMMARVRASLSRGNTPPKRDMPLDLRSKRSLAYAAEAVGESGRLTTGHLLVGLLRENGYALGRYVGVPWLSFERVPARISNICQQFGS